MSIAIFGVNPQAIYLKNELNKCENSNIKAEYFVDNNKALWGTAPENIPVISAEQLKELYPNKIDAVLISARGTHSRISIIHQLKNMGILNAALVKPSVYDYSKAFTINGNINDDEIIWINKTDKPLMPYLEINISDACNLNCMGCTHFANLFNCSDFYDFETFKSDLSELCKNVFIAQLRLLGGEPLLNPDLSKYIAFARSIMPDTDICVVSNGILVPKQPAELFEVMNKSNVGFVFSKYKPTLKMRDKIEQVLKAFNVQYVFDGEEITEFSRNLSRHRNNNPELSQKACHSRGCRFLRNGRLYKCPTEGLIYRYYEYYGLENNFKAGINIYDKLDWNKVLIDLMEKPVEMCSRCSEKSELFKWDISITPSKEEWLSNEEDF